MTAMALALSGCTILHPGLASQRLAPGEVPTPIGTPVRDNRSPMEAALACFGDQLVAQNGPRRVIAVGDVKDYTGKYSINEGNAITQGGALMVYSALGKIGGPLAIAERFDPTIAERELGYTDRRQLGDGDVHEVNGNRVPWLPYFGGSITRSDYYIVGGITELNYDIRSGGGEIEINNVGPKARVFTESVAVDLRIVNSRSLEVIKTVSLTKQFTGYEIGANVFRFFGTTLFDINVGAKGQEPLQLGVRTALEEATMKLIAAVAKVDPSTCMAQRLETIPDLTADQLRGRALAKPAGQIAPVTPPAPPPPPSAASALTGQQVTTLNDLTSAGAAPSGAMLQIGFEFGDTALMGNAQAVLDQIVQAAAKGPVDVMIIARDTENWDPAKRDSLLDGRLAAVVSALANRGIAPAGISVTWRPDKADTSIHRDGPGMQEIARIQIRK
ncbi:CsgG/HfaB family protein [Novosphingobium sp.]|uniref:CsgG/HfaB family protein n=1 Tax=Novosphingobium sp. TaxID=1874826 RepID=UPI002635B969|nr:CsgG/HfaB family protein [Novosphingobium sp.]